MALDDIKTIETIEGEGPIEDMRQLESDLKTFKDRFSNEKIKNAKLPDIKAAYVDLQLLLEKYKSIKSQESLLSATDRIEYNQIKARINLGPLAFDNAFTATTILPEDRSLDGFASKNILSAMNVLQGIPERIKKITPLNMIQEKEKIVYDMKRIQKVFDNVRKDESYVYLYQLMDHQLVTLGDNMLDVWEFMDDVKLDEFKDVQERISGYIKQITGLEKQKKWKTESGLGYQASWVNFNRAESFVQQEGVDRLISDVFGLDVNSSNPAVQLIIDQLKAQLVDFNGDYTVFNAGPMVSQSAIKEMFKSPNLKIGNHKYQMTYRTGYTWKTAVLNTVSPLQKVESYVAALVPGGGPGLFIKEILSDASTGEKTTERPQMSFSINTGLDLAMKNTPGTITHTVSGWAGYKIDESLAADEKFFEDGNNLLGSIGQFLPGVENTVKDQLTRFPGKYAVFGPPAGATWGAAYKFQIVPIPDAVPNLSVWFKGQYEHMKSKYGIDVNNAQLLAGLDYRFGGKKKK